MKRRALFVGVNEYKDPEIRDLGCSVRDAISMHDIFQMLGYQTRLLENPSKVDVFNAIREMTEGGSGEEALKPGDQFLMYFAGHGFTDSGQHLLFCNDDMYRQLRFHRAGIPFDQIEEETRGGGFDRAFLLDACQTDFLTGTRGEDATTRDLVAIGDMVPKSEDATGAFYVLRSCSKYEHALEVGKRGHGLFTLGMLEVLRNSKEEGSELLFNDALRESVWEKMRGIARAEGMTVKQTPESDSRGATQVLISGVKATIQPVPSGSPTSAAMTLVLCPSCGFRNREEQTFRCRVCGRDYLCTSHFDKKERCCEDCAAAKRKERVAAEREDAERKALEKAEREAREDAERKAGTAKIITLPGGADMELVWCPPGEFIMGSPEDEEGRFDDETQHRVRLTKGFWLGKYPVTQKQWRSVMGDNPSHFKGDNRPVEQVSWNNCQGFIRKVKDSLNCEVRLPTEAEWEYACRAGTTGAYGGCGKLDEMGWYVKVEAKSKWFGLVSEEVSAGTGETHPVGQKMPNAWGLYDMHGNVYEWCNDNYGDYADDEVDPRGPDSRGSSIYVLRGGSWSSFAQGCRSADRRGNNDNYRSSIFGFRICCSAGRC